MLSMDSIFLSGEERHRIAESWCKIFMFLLDIADNRQILLEVTSSINTASRISTATAKLMIPLWHARSLK